MGGCCSGRSGERKRLTKQTERERKEGEEAAARRRRTALSTPSVTTAATGTSATGTSEATTDYESGEDSDESWAS
eukprot:3490297-Pyramimonas_sp.AAC.1